MGSAAWSSNKPTSPAKGQIVTESPWAGPVTVLILHPTTPIPEKMAVPIRLYLPWFADINNYMSEYAEVGVT
jgi:hypothetical protein